MVEQDLYSLGGEALVLVYPKSAGKVVAVVGQGWAPAAATIDWYRDNETWWAPLKAASEARYERRGQ